MKTRAYYHPWLRRLPVISSLYRAELRSLTRILETSELDPQWVLDIGTGTGSSLRVFSRDATLIGLDRDPAVIQKAGKGKRVHGLAGNASALPVASNACPFISMIGVSEYVAEKADLLFELERCLECNGYCLITICRRHIGNWIRILSGYRLFLISEKVWELLVLKKNFQILDKRRTFLQTAYLLQKQS